MHVVDRNDKVGNSIAIGASTKGAISHMKIAAETRAELDRNHDAMLKQMTARSPSAPAATG